MTDKYKDDLGNEICCANCDTTAREYFEGEKLQENWFTGQTWYCSTECYEEHTKDEG